MDHRVVPRTIFTDPQVVTVGLTEEEGIAAGHRGWCNTLPMSHVPRAGAIRDTRGTIKMVADAKTDEGHWPGTADGLSVLWRAAGLPGTPNLNSPAA